MNINEAKDAICENWENIIKGRFFNSSLAETKKINRENSYICPKCGHGAHGEGIVYDKSSKSDNSLKCFDCGFQGNIIDLYMECHGMNRNAKEEFIEALKILADDRGITIDNESGTGTRKQVTQHSNHNTANTIQETETDYTELFLKANQDIEKTEYHRGLSLSTLNAFNIGYIENWRHPKSPKMELSPRLIIPNSKYSYTARYAGEKDFINYQGKKANKSKVGTQRLFNGEALYRSKYPVFITEGEINAMSIYEVGGEAVAMGSTANWGKLIEAIKDNKPTQPLIIALDNDRSGEEGYTKLAEELEKLNINYYRYTIAKPYNDTNEALIADREAFTASIDRMIEEVTEEENAKAEAERNELKKEAVAYSLDSFKNAIIESSTAEYIPTGFPGLDQILDGGLYAGLYIVGAISSLGKTTFCLQIADQIAQTGEDVLVFSLEMARNELIGKSISRLTHIYDYALHRTTEHAKPTRGILNGSRYKNYGDTEKQLIDHSIAAYSDYAKNLYITEGVGNVGITEIRERIEKHIRITGKAPVVVIDYLQILAPYNERYTDKQNTDKAVLELKRLSRDYKIPIIGISSFNRENYTAPVNLTSFKESGAIEYSSDVLIGLQYKGMDYIEGEKEKDRDPRIRKLIKEAIEAGKAGKAQQIQVKILKNRNGSKGDTCIDFYPMFNNFDIIGIGKSKDQTEETEWQEIESIFE